MGVSLNGGTRKTPQNDHVVGKPMVVGYQHFRKLPYMWIILEDSGRIHFKDGPFWHSVIQLIQNSSPIRSLYGIFTYFFMVNIGKYTMHESYGSEFIDSFRYKHEKGFSIFFCCEYPMV